MLRTRVLRSDMMASLPFRRVARVPHVCARGYVRADPLHRGLDIPPRFYDNPSRSICSHALRTQDDVANHIPTSRSLTGSL